MTAGGKGRTRRDRRGEGNNLFSCQLVFILFLLFLIKGTTLAMHSHRESNGLANIRTKSFTFKDIEIKSSA